MCEDRLYRRTVLNRTHFRLLFLCATIFGLAYIPARITIARHRTPQPQLIFVLGGGNDRERFAGHLAQAYPDLNIWVSSGSPSGITEFVNAQIPLDRVYLDYRASDTVTNFTSVVHDLKQQNIEHVYLVTSDFHLARAQTIAFLVFGAQGIAVTPVTVSSEKPKESPLRIARDAGRSLLWLSVGRTGASLGRRFRQT